MDEKLMEMQNDIYGKDDKKKIIKAVILVVVVVLAFIIIMVIKNKHDYKENTENFQKYAEEYYNKYMKTANPASVYVVNLEMLENTDKYDLSYFKKCDKRDTNLNILVDSEGNITKTKLNLECK